MSEPVKDQVIAELAEKIRKAKVEVQDRRERIADLRLHITETEIRIEAWEQELTRISTNDMPKTFVEGEVMKLLETYRSREKTSLAQSEELRRTIVDAETHLALFKETVVSAFRSHNLTLPEDLKPRSIQ